MLVFHKIVTHIALVAVLFWTVKNAALFTIYEIDQETFVELFCENKEKPELECNGQCQIEHMSQEKDNGHNDQLIPMLQTEVFFYHQTLFEGIQFSLALVFKEPKEYGSIAQAHYTDTYYAKYDKPPTF